MKSLLASLALLTVACGAPAPTGGNTPPPGGTVAAVLAVQAGDGQQAEPGATLTVRPTVAVKDAAGLGVAGVTVNFAVDSGGGTLQATSAVTAADGSASPGDWHLGSDEGRNVMSATSGSLAKVKFVATAVVAPVTIADQAVGSGGGTITVDRPGSPINGMSIQVQAGGYTAGQTIGVSYTSSASVAHMAGVSIGSPLVTIRASDGGYAKTPMLLTIPTTVPAGMFPVIVLYGAGGRQEVLPTVGYTATSVTAVTKHFNSARLMGTDGSIAAAPASLRDPSATAPVVVQLIPTALLDLDHDTGFRPGVDSWEFEPIRTVASTSTSAAAAGTALWYYAAHKADGKLWKKYQEAEGVDWSNRRGLRWLSVAENSIYDGLHAGVDQVVDRLKPNTNPQFSSMSFQTIRTALLLYPTTPVLAEVQASTGDQANDGSLDVLVYQAANQKLYAVDPADPGESIVIDFSSGSMAPLTITGFGTFQMLVAAGVTALAPLDALAGQYAAVVAGTIGNDLFPTFQSRVGWGTAVGESADLRDPFYVFGTDDKYTVRYWFDCVTCHGELRPPDFPAGTAELTGIQAYIAPTGGTGPWSLVGTGGGVITKLSSAGFRQLGAVVLSHPSSSDPSLSWTDWVAMKEYRLPATITPTPATGTTNTDVTLTLALEQAPGNLEYEWDFADGQTNVTTTLATTHKWTTAGTYAMNATARDKTTKEPVARASASVVITPPTQVWKFTTKSLVFSTSGNFSLNFGYTDGRWLVDSTILARIAAGVSQGGIRLVDAPFTPPGAPLRTAPAGIYLLEGASITLATLDDPATDNNFITTTFANAPLALPAAPRVSGWNLVQDAAPVNPLCNVHADTYTRTGTITAGHVTGLRVPLCVQSASLPVTNGQPLMSMEADVQFIGDGASGTITIAYHFYGEGLQSQNNAQRIGRLTFEATRVTQ